jgi:hypothetical protein
MSLKREYVVGQMVEIYDKRINYYAVGKIVGLSSTGNGREFYLVNANDHVFHVEKKRLTSLGTISEKNEMLDSMFECLSVTTARMSEHE